MCIRTIARWFSRTERARRAAANYDHDRAIVLLSKTLARRPNDTAALRLRAFSYTQQKNFWGALGDWKEIIEIQPNLKAHYNISQCFYWTENYPAAIRHLTAVINKMRERRHAPEWQGMSDLLDENEREINPLNKSPYPQSLTLRALAYMQTEQYALAAEDFCEALTFLWADNKFVQIIEKHFAKHKARLKAEIARLRDKVVKLEQHEKTLLERVEKQNQSFERLVNKLKIKARAAELKEMTDLYASIAGFRRRQCQLTEEAQGQSQQEQLDAAHQSHSIAHQALFALEDAEEKVKFFQTNPIT
ncbi:MAG: hypothetical protein QME05_03370 [Candidatus Margulisbacteria bacterium]|nr:hypothetical protein [Candidatus Margulisiibacteriota bacterium]